MAQKIRNYKNAACLISTIALTTGLVVYWHSVNRGYPSRDCAEFALVALRSYWTFFTDGVFSGLHAFYTLRTWRTISYPEILLPGFFLSGGNVLLALAIVATVLYGTLTWIVYELARIWLEPVGALLVVAFLLNLPWIRPYEHVCVYELPMFVFFSASWLAALRSSFFKNRRLAFLSAAFAGIALTISPGESLFLISFTLFAYVISGVRKKTIPWSDVKMAIAEGFIFSLPIVAAVLMNGKFNQGAPGNILWAPEADISKFSLTLFGIVVASAVYWKWGRKASKTSLPLYVLVIGWIVVLWFGPYFWQVGQWLKIASYDPKTSFYDFPMMLKERLGFSTFFEGFKGNFWGAGTTALFLIATFEAWIFRKKKSKEKKRPELNRVFLTLFLLVLVQSVLAIRGFNPNLRYLTLGLASLHFAALTIFCRSPFFPRTKRAILALCVALLMLSQFKGYGIFDKNELSRIPSLFGSGAILPPVRQEDGSVQFLKFITDNIDTNLPVLIYPTKDPYITWAEPNTTTLISTERGFAVWGSWRHGNWREATRQDGSTTYGYYVLGPLEFTSPDLLEQVRNDAPISMRPIVFKPDGGPAATFLLIKN